MITGTVNWSREAVIKLSVIGGLQADERIEAVVDTGFSGFLTPPPAVIDRLGLHFQRRGIATLADGSSVLYDIYRGTVLWDGEPCRLSIDEADTEPLVGMGLLHGYELAVQVVDGFAVTIRRLPPL